MLSQGISAILHQRGSLLLHSNAVSYNGKAVLFAGNSGAGKSTISAEFIKNGFDLISDDICVMIPDENKEYKLETGLGELKLWQDSMAILKEKNYLQEKIRPELEKFRILLNQNNDDKIYDILRIYNINTNSLRPFEINHTKDIQKIRILKNITYRKNLVGMIGDSVKHFFHITNLAKQVDIRNINRPREKSDSSELFNLIIKDLENA